jgi:hypothetical protein
MEGVTAMKKKLITASMVLLLLMPFLFGGCGFNTPVREGFAIYLIKDNIVPDKIKTLNDAVPADTPVLSGEDIIAYKWDTQEIEITAEAWDRLGAMQVPTGGKSFVVCVDKTPIYWGAFWTPISSQSYSGVMIERPLTLPAGTNRYFIYPTLGYPSASFYSGTDPRYNPIIKEALEKAGKLK